MSVAVFTDNDFDKVNGVTTTLTAVLQTPRRHRAAHLHRVAARRRDHPDYLALRSFGVGIPFYREMKMYVPHSRRISIGCARIGIDVIHLTTPGPWAWRRCGSRRRRSCR